MPDIGSRPETIKSFPALSTRSQYSISEDSFSIAKKSIGISARISSISFAVRELLWSATADVALNVATKHCNNAVTNLSHVLQAVRKSQIFVYPLLRQYSFIRHYTIVVNRIPDNSRNNNYNSLRNFYKVIHFHQFFSNLYYFY